MRYHAFLSFSSADREKAQRIYDNLDARGIRIWWDFEDLRSRGRDVGSEIREAIKESGEHFLLLCGSTTFERKYVMEELKLAIRECKIIVPLRLSGCPPLPEQLEKLPRRDLSDPRLYEKTIGQVVADLQSAAAPLAALKGGIPKDDSTSERGWLRRNDLLDRLAQTVIPGGPAGVISTVQITKIVGMGGIGKSVLAAQFVRMCEVRRSYSDGIVWIRIGSEERPERVLQNIGRILSDSYGDYSDENSAIKSLQAELAGRSCLIVLDDVREVEQLEMVRRALPDGSAAHLLVTTRRSSLLNQNSRAVRVKLLDDEEALKLLLQYSGTATKPNLKVAASIIQLCGRLPLALAMVGSMLSEQPPDPDDWNQVLKLLENAELEEIEAELPDYESHNLFLALHVSVEALDSELAERYVDLVVFGGNPVPKSALKVFWSSQLTSKWIKKLVGRSLLGYNEFDRLTMHNLQFDYLRARFAQREVPITSLHGRLVEQYEKRCNGVWTTLEDDGYALEAIVGHLLLAGREDEVHQLLWPAGEKNIWYKRKQRILGSYLDDVRAAWAAVNNRGEHSSDWLVIQSRYALISASIVSVGKNISGVVLCIATERGEVTEDEALTLALGVDDLRLRAKTLAKLTAHLSVDGLKEAAVQEVSRIFRSQFMKYVDWPLHLDSADYRLMASVVAEDTILEVLEIVQNKDSDAGRAILVPRLAELGYSGRAEEESRKIQDDSLRVRALAEVARFLDANARLDLLAEARRTTRNGNYIVECLAEFGSLDDALELYREYGGGPNSRKAIVQRAVRNDDTERALELARELAWHAFERATLLAEVVPALPMEQRLDIVDEAFRYATTELSTPTNYDENRRQCLALASIAGYRKDGHDILDRLLYRALDPNDPLLRDEAIDILAPRLPSHLFQRLWDTTRRVNDYVAVSQARIGIARCLPEPRNIERLVEILASIDWRNVPYYEVDELVGPLADASPLDVKRVLEHAVTQKDIAPKVIEQLLLYAHGLPLPPQALTIWINAIPRDKPTIEKHLKDVQPDEDRAILLARVSRFQDHEEARQSVTEATEIAVKNASWNSGSLVTMVAAETPDEHRDLVLELAEEGLKNIDLKMLLSEYTDAIENLALYLPPRRLPEALELLLDMSSRPRSMRSLARRLVDLDESHLASLWSRALLHLARRGRAYLLVNLHALSPVIKRLGGTEALDALDDSIGDIIRWWP